MSFNRNRGRKGLAANGLPEKLALNTWARNLRKRPRKSRGHDLSLDVYRAELLVEIAKLEAEAERDALERRYTAMQKRHRCLQDMTGVLGEAWQDASDIGSAHVSRMQAAVVGTGCNAGGLKGGCQGRQSPPFGWTEEHLLPEMRTIGDLASELHGGRPCAYADLFTARPNADAVTRATGDCESIEAWRRKRPLELLNWLHQEDWFH